MRDTVACTHDRSPGDFRVGLADRVRDMGSRFPYQFQIPQSGIIGEIVADEGVLIHSVGKELDFLGEFNHVIHVKTPFP